MLKEENLAISGPELEQLAKDAVHALLRDIQGAKGEILAESSRPEWDFEVHFSLEGSPRTLLCEVKTRAWPNELHGVGHRINRALQNHTNASCTPVFIAPYLSPQAIEVCDDLGLSWADLAGNCELTIKGAYVKVIGNPNPYKRGRGTASLYSPKSAAIVQALLLAPHRRWTTNELSKESGASLGQVASVKKLLEKNNWIRASYGETSLTEPKKLLDDWVLNYQPRRKTIRLFTLESPEKLEDRVATNLSGYAFTEFSAAHRYAPYTRHQRVAFYVSKWDETQSAVLGLKGGEGAANVAVYETGESLAFVEELGGKRCVSPILTYLDLKALSGRGQDAAEHLFESIVEPRWK